MKNVIITVFASYFFNEDKFMYNDQYNIHVDVTGDIIAQVKEWMDWNIFNTHGKEPAQSFVAGGYYTDKEQKHRPFNKDNLTTVLKEFA